ncbi:13619_t:CDS:10 [Entrophospora sp. SA101]|nr:13619_t:CDS:10 [Entrophospora sp. SA101]CAJ0826165.1 20132_t:CDS:10 [Entrophospora sp. SA101]CAJ0864074.1 4957_t:CDS:10 [Entrophospora sp. SA101]
MNKTSTKTLIALLVVLISFIFIVEFTSPIQSINIGHLQKRQTPAPPPDNPPPKDNPPPPPKDNPPPPPKDNPSPAPQPTPDATPNPNPSPPAPSAPQTPAPNPDATPTPDPNATPTPDPNATPTPDPNATPTPNPTPSPNAPAPNPSAPPTPDPNAPTSNSTTTVVSITSDTTTNTVSPIVDSSVVTNSTGTNADTNAGPSSSPNTGVTSISSTVSQSTTTSYPPGREPCTKADDPRCERKTTDPTVVSTTEENEIITQPSTTPAAPTKSQSQLAPNPKKSTITQFTTYTTTSTIYHPGYSTVTSSKGTDGELTTYATYIPPSTVVVVKKVTSAKVEEIQETNPSSAGHLDLELSVYNLYSVATSLSVIAVTMLYLIVA